MSVSIDCGSVFIRSTTAAKIARVGIINLFRVKSVDANATDYEQAYLDTSLTSLISNHPSDYLDFF